MERPKCQCGVRIHHTFETKEVPGSGHHGRAALHREDCGAGTLVVEVALVVATCQRLGYEKKLEKKHIKLYSYIKKDIQIHINMILLGRVNWPLVG